MKYIRLEISMPAELQEIFISEFFDLEFSGFEQMEDRLVAYVPDKDFGDSDREFLQQWLNSQRDHCYIIAETMELSRDYNEEWEKTIQPVCVGDFYIRPSWSTAPPPDGLMVLVIDPKMAFGTGYHETTRLMLRNMTTFVTTGSRVLDVGTGTGILSIAAIKKGAGLVLGFDTDEWSYSNARENAEVNMVSDRLEIKSGSFECVEDDDEYDLILANVNRNALLEMAESLVNHLKKEGMLMLSGLLIDEKDLILGNQWFGSLTTVKLDSEGEWIMIALRK